MRMTRRHLVRFSALAAPSFMLPGGMARAAGLAKAPVKPLRIPILGGAGFIGPHEVRHALARGHKVTIFNRGRQPKDWPGAAVDHARHAGRCRQGGRI